MFSKLRRYLPLSSARLETKLNKINKKIENNQTLSKKNVRELKKLRKELEHCKAVAESAISKTDKILCTYDEVVSLGYNCEVSFRIIDALDGVNDIASLHSYPYSWAYVFSRSLFYETFYNPNLFLSGEIELTPAKMLKCSASGISFHLKNHGEELLDEKGEFSDELYQKAVADTKSRIMHLYDKFINLVNSDKKTLFILKVSATNPTEDSDFIFEVYKILLSMYKSGRFTLLVVMEERSLSKEILKMECDRIKIRTVKEFANDCDTKEGGDREGWVRVIREFV